MRRFFSYLVLIAAPSVLFAQETLNLLVDDLPVIGPSTDLAGFLTGIFRLSLGLAITAAIIIIAWNGIRYMTTDVVDSKGDAVKWIKDALWGLALAFGAVLILNTINPQLTEFNFLNTLQDVGDAAQPTGGGGGDGGGSGDDDNPPEPGDSEEVAIRQQLRDAGIGVNKPACTTPGQTNCTNVAGLPGDAIARLISLKEACACGGFTVSGGTEAGHSTHGVGRPMIDLYRNSNITRFLLEHATPVRNTCIGQLYSYGGSEFLDETVGDPHWHACFGTTCSFRPGC